MLFPKSSQSSDKVMIDPAELSLPGVEPEPLDALPELAPSEAPTLRTCLISTAFIVPLSMCPSPGSRFSVLLSRAS
jgi:hypothetical protein